MSHGCCRPDMHTGRLLGLRWGAGKPCLCLNTAAADPHCLPSTHPLLTPCSWCEAAGLFPLPLLGGTLEIVTVQQPY